MKNKLPDNSLQVLSYLLEVNGYIVKIPTSDHSYSVFSFSSKRSFFFQDIVDGLTRKINKNTFKYLLKKRHIKPISLFFCIHNAKRQKKYEAQVFSLTPKGKKIATPKKEIKPLYDEIDNLPF